MSHEFAKAGLHVARPMFMFEQRFGFIRRNAFYASEALAGQELLTILPTLPEPEQRLVAKKIIDCFTVMQEHLISHGDLKASNILWVNRQLYFIDLDAAKKHTTNISWQIAHKKDVKRFLKNWRDEPKLIGLFSQYGLIN
jgi:predicted Ser/Thr protein kinase